MLAERRRLVAEAVEAFVDVRGRLTTGESVVGLEVGGGGVDSRGLGFVTGLGAVVDGLGLELEEAMLASWGGDCL